MSLTAIFCEIDDFCKSLAKLMGAVETEGNKNKAGRKRVLTSSDILTIIVYFHHSGFRTFKEYYNVFIKMVHRTAFNGIVSYHRFVELMRDAMIPLYFFINLNCLGEVTGIAFIDSTKLPVCNNLRINSHRVFKGVATRGKTSTGWFFGFKLHLIINEYGEILSFTLSRGNTDDRDDSVIDQLTKFLHGKLFGDRGYISSELFKKLFEKGIHLFTKVKKNMKNKLMQLEDKVLLKKRGLIECVIKKLKLECQIDHTRHRSHSGFLVNLFAGIAAYKFFEKKPNLVASQTERNVSLLLA